MRWTSEKPTTTGWYWWRETNRPDILQEVVLVWNTGEVRRAGWDGTGDINDMGGKFLGPITPEEDEP